LNITGGGPYQILKKPKDLGGGKKNKGRRIGSEKGGGGFVVNWKMKGTKKMQRLTKKPANLKKNKRGNAGKTSKW